MCVKTEIASASKICLQSIVIL
uniref:Uncharacterized protein n=1 Tax=Anguilla anguilla TaxID=7936 RepID=A0A0E9W581_ANGAN